MRMRRPAFSVIALEISINDGICEMISTIRRVVD
jgi:hypothetical protein